MTSDAIAQWLLARLALHRNVIEMTSVSNSNFDILHVRRVFRSWEVRRTRVASYLLLPTRGRAIVIRDDVNS